MNELFVFSEIGMVKSRNTISNPAPPGGYMRNFAQKAVFRTMKLNACKAWHIGWWKFIPNVFVSRPTLHKILENNGSSNAYAECFHGKTFTLV